jgi:hypothetical protein
MSSSDLRAAARLGSIKSGQLCNGPLHNWNLIGNREAGWQ